MRINKISRMYFFKKTRVYNYSNIGWKCICQIWGLDTSLINSHSILDCHQSPVGYCEWLAGLISFDWTQHNIRVEIPNECRTSLQSFSFLHNCLRAWGPCNIFPFQLMLYPQRAKNDLHSITLGTSVHTNTSTLQQSIQPWYTLQGSAGD